MARGWVALVVLLTVWLGPGATTSGAADDAEVAKLRSELEQLRGRLPSQSHAMMDVGYHFTNLWFAAQSKNWPLAQFYLDETRSHLRWAVRIVPVRRTPGGEIDLRGLLEAVDQAALAEVGKAIAGRDPDGFTAAYRQRWWAATRVTRPPTSRTSGRGSPSSRRRGSSTSIPPRPGHSPSLV